MAASLSGDELPPVPYDLSDMAADAVGLLDHLGIERAHVMGASMGGMIAQTIAIEHPQRCLSLISVMSSPGDPRAGKPAPEALAVLLSVPPSDRDAYIAAADRTAVWTSKRYHDQQRRAIGPPPSTTGRSTRRAPRDSSPPSTPAATAPPPSPTWTCRPSSSTGATTP